MSHWLRKNKRPIYVKKKTPLYYFAEFQTKIGIPSNKNISFVIAFYKNPAHNPSSLSAAEHSIYRRYC